MARGRNTPPGPLTGAIAAVLYDAFLESLMTQAQLGARVGIPQSMVSEYLRGMRVLDIELLARLCDALDISLGETVNAAQSMLPRSDRPDET